MTTHSVPLSELVEFNPTPGRNFVGPEVVSFLGMADVSERGTTASGEDREYSAVSKGYTPFRNGDILVAKITPCFQNGKIAQARINHDVGAGSTEFHVVRPRDGVDGRYVLRFLRQEWIRREGESRMTGSGGQRRVPEVYLRALKIPFPPLAEQKRIAAVLDQLDTLRAKRRDAITLLDDLTQSIFLDMFGNPATNSMGWPLGTVKEILESATYGTSEKASLSGDVPVLRMGNVTSTGEIDMTNLKYLTIEQASEKYMVRRGDVLFNRTNSAELVGKSAIYRRDESVAYAGYLVRLRVDESNNPEYLAAYLNSAYAKAWFRAKCKSIVGMANINAKEVQAMRIAMPPLDLQMKFAESVKALESVKRAHRAHLAALDELFESLQQRAYSGQLWDHEAA
ncbi:restriction endonuclease subunit S [Streptomyces sp. NPDC005752]|uniref:restriction endonuclease subunit S n=1 Tax=Streptomyces sp. NPDC005752 TaxID=3157065 RepID=UPI0033DA2ABE